MRVITANIPIFMLERIDLFVREHDLYSGRSDFVRAAVREYLLKELPNLALYERRAEEKRDDLALSLDMRGVRWNRW